MVITVRQLDVWRRGGSRRLVARDGIQGNLFQLISCGTGEVVEHGLTDAQVFDSLVRGAPPINTPYLFEFNLARDMEKRLIGYGPFAPLVVWREDVTDPTVLAMRREEERRQRHADETFVPYNPFRDGD